MSQAPAMPVFTDALIGDTTHLDAALFGAYCSILFVTWRNNGIPLKDDDARMARVARMTPAQWRKAREILAEFFDLSGGTWRQKRLEKEWEFLQEKLEKNRHNGTLGGRPKSLNNRETTKAKGSNSLNPNHNPNESTQTQTHIEDSSSEESPYTPRQIIELFEAWWSAYPSGRKGGKPKCIEKYTRIVKSGAATPAQLLDGAKRYADAGYSGSKFVKGPMVWLNGSHWGDEDIPTPGDMPLFGKGTTHDGTIPPWNNSGNQRRPSDHERRAAIADVFADVLADDGRSACSRDQPDAELEPVC